MVCRDSPDFVILSLFAFISSCAAYQQASGSPCYVDGRAYKCITQFANIVENVPSEVTSTCGSPPKEICRSWTDSMGRPQTTCDMCDAENPHKSHPSLYLTDRHISNNQTCWISGPVDPGSDVNITLSLHKRFEVNYISLQPCGPLPDAIAIYKSSDFGKSWRPWQYFSSDCYRSFRLPTSNPHDSQITSANIQEVLCMPLNQNNVDGQRADTMIAFGTTTGRPLSQPYSPALVDWMTMTDLRITMMRFPKRRDSRSHLPSSYLPRDYYSQMMGDQRNPKPVIPALGDTRGDFSEPIHFAFSDLAVGGWCKCNGHASRCVRQPHSGRLTCDCEHNTEGDDCERCKISFYDRPWARATSKSANECKPCECYFHSHQCVFDKRLYLASNRTSGGVCQDCTHNTMGPRCQYCKDGYYRDRLMPLGHIKQCIPCRCHPYGALDKNTCNNITGQCVCKEGVSGLLCDRCMDGYKQNRRAHVTPCIKKSNIPPMARAERPIHPMVPKPQVQPHKPSRVDQSPQNFERPVQGNPEEPLDPKCKSCGRVQKRIRFKKFCRKNVVFQAVLLQQMKHGEFVRFDMRVANVWRRDNRATDLIPDKASLDTFGLWVRAEDLHCRCPHLAIGYSYLIISKASSRNFQGRKELFLTNKSIVLPWQEAWKRRLAKFRRRDKRGVCKQFTRKASKIRRVGRKKLSSSRSYSTNVNSPAVAPYQPSSSYKQYQNRYYNDHYNSNYGYYNSAKQ